MFGNGIFSWFSSSKEECNHATWDATTVQTQQPTAIEAPSTNEVISEQPVFAPVSLASSAASAAAKRLTILAGLITMIP
ncbi:hypothetical protein N7495_006369 [Penicillium taxi]|uniref:uncharacterized protein n=1 Tax=Penicillium taxi TaxID=168475 RepID=UPI0025454A5E|nr:uncharacterized protein N7495_006369 [Penicillium taxi]KAJ5894678.1 hypothetical protein N7495_006369 [Penicillium taxi]